MKKSLPSYIAHKGKNLTEARYSLDLVEQKTLDLAISKVNPNSNELINPYTVKASELIELNELDENRYAGRAILKAAKKLRETTIMIHNEDKNTLIGVGLITKFEYIYEKKDSEKNVVLKIFFDEELKGELLYNAKAYQAKKLGGAFKLRGKWSYRLYDIMNQWKASGKCSYEYKDFREILGVPEGSYKDHKDLLKRVIRPSIKEINEVSDMNLEFNLLFSHGISPETGKTIGFPHKFEFMIIPSKATIQDNSKRKRGRKPKLIEDNQSVLSDHMDQIYPTEMQDKLTKLGIVHLNKLKSEGITEEIWNLTFAEEPSDEPRHLVTTARRIKDQRSILPEQAESNELINSNKKYWEENSHKYSGLMASTAYIQSNSGDIIKWIDDDFENKLRPFLKDED